VLTCLAATFHQTQTPPEEAEKYKYKSQILYYRPGMGEIKMFALSSPFNLMDERDYNVSVPFRYHSILAAFL
jgi:hypothetical protein